MRLLVADDDHAICALLRMQLERAEYDVVEVHDEAGVLHALVMDPTIQLIIIDWEMEAGSNGIELVRKIDGLGRQVYIIILTGHRESSTVAATLDAGAHDYIMKPWNEEVLLARVRVGKRTLKLQSELFLQSKALESAANAIVITDRDGTIHWVNPAFTQLTGYTAGDAVGNKPSVLKSGKQDDAFYSELWQTVLAGNVWKGVLTNQRKDGSEYVEEMTITPVRSQGEITHFIAIKYDITEQRNLQTQLNHAQKLEAIGQLAAGIAHEINTPTQYVGDNTRFMRDGIDDIIKLIQLYEKLLGEANTQSCGLPIIEEIDQTKKDIDLDFLIEELPAAVRQSLEGVDRVAEIVRAMKDFSHPGGEDKTPADINQALRSTITVCRNRWKYVADLETDFDDSIPTVPCLISEFNQVILNIIVNAADAIAEQTGDSPEQKGKIIVTTRSTDEMVIIQITDNGPGIPEKIHNRIFEPFFTTKEVGKGTGQGLAICHDVIVNKHGGKINFQSGPEGGTIFTVQLPIRETQIDDQNRRAA